MADIRIGRQTPTDSFVLPYQKTLGSDAIDVYQKTGKTAMDWEKLLTYDMLAVNDDDLWTHTKFGYEVPRRNGKNEVIIIRELFGLIQRGEKILHTAHRTTTSHAAWERLCDNLAEAGLKEDEDYRTIKQFGLERIEMLNSEGRISFRTRSSKGGLGEGFDLLIIDEAQEYTNDQQSALKYVVTDSKNPQTIFCGTPPTAVSAGTVFPDMRKKVFAGKMENAAWSEWSVPAMTDVNDVDAWYETNPSLGIVFTERSIRDEIGSDDLDFNIQRLGLWITYNQKSAISEKEWMALKVTRMPKLTGQLFVGIKYGYDGSNVSMAIAVRTAEDKIFLEAIDCRPVRDGNRWILDFLRKADWASVTIDGQAGKLLADDMKALKMKAPQFLTGREYLLANTNFEKGLFEGHICHNGQKSLAQVISNCEKRASGSSGGFAYKSQKIELDISLMDSVILAYSACAAGKTRKKQRILF